MNSNELHGRWFRRLGTSTLAHNIVALYATQIGAYLFPLAVIPYLSRVLGPFHWGLVAFAQAVGLYVTLLIDFGFTLSATRRVARFRTDKGGAGKNPCRSSRSEVVTYTHLRGFGDRSAFHDALFSDAPGDVVVRSGLRNRTGFQHVVVLSGNGKDARFSHHGRCWQRTSSRGSIRFRTSTRRRLASASLAEHLLLGSCRRSPCDGISGGKVPTP